MRWLAEQIPRTPGLQTQYCRSVVEDFLQEHFYSRVLYNLKQRKLQGYLHQVMSRPMLYCGSINIHGNNSHELNDFLSFNLKLSNYVN